MPNSSTQNRMMIAVTTLGLAISGCTTKLQPPSLAMHLGSERLIRLAEPAAQPVSASEQSAKRLLAGDVLLEKEAVNLGPILAPTPQPTAPPAAPDSKLRSQQLPNGLFNPLPGGVFAGYGADTGLDIGGYHLPVFALASGTLDYSEPGHTLWVGPRDTANTIRFELDEPIPYKGRLITHVWYAHLSKLEHRQKEGAAERRHVEGGELLGVSGIANGSPHLHIGLLLDGEVEQYWGTYLKEHEVREILGGYRNGQRLPSQPK